MSMNAVRIEEILEANGLKTVENPEWLWVVLDGADHVLFGIKHDGAVEWAIGVPEPVRNEIDAMKKRITELEILCKGLSRRK